MHESRPFGAGRCSRRGLVKLSFTNPRTGRIRRLPASMEISMEALNGASNRRPAGGEQSEMPGPSAAHGKDVLKGWSGQA